MLRTTLANLRAHKARHLLLSITIVLATAFLAGSFMFTDAVRSALTGAFAQDLGNADIVVTVPGTDEIPPDVLAAVGNAGGVATVHGRAEGIAALRMPDGPVLPARTVSVAADPGLGWPALTAGRLPNQSGEAVLDTATAQRSRLGVGDTAGVGWDGHNSPAGQRQTLRIVGVVDPGNSPRYAGTPLLGVTTEQALAALPDTDGFTMILAAGVSGVPVAELATRIDTEVGPPYQVLTGQQHTQQQVSSMLSTNLTATLLAFAGIALFVAALVIANTFNILLAQRTRQMALLRCVGATRAQAFGSVLAESAILGIVGSAVGVLVGYGLAYAVGSGLSVWLDNFPFGAVALSAPAVVVPLVVGTAVTVGAALLPARAATRIPPVAALRDTAVPPTPRAGRFRIVLAAVMVLAGASGLFAGTVALSSTAGLAAAFFGAAAVFLGVLLATPILTPPLVRLCGVVLGRVLGTPGRLAAVNAIRNPRRAAATTSALLVGATLISVMSVGAASTRATVNAELDNKFPVDFMVRAESGMPTSVVDDIRDIPGLAAVTAVHGTYIPIQGRPVWVSGYNPHELAAVTAQLPALTQLQPGEVVVYQSLAHQLGIGPGDTLRLGDSPASQLTVSSVLDLEGAPAAAFTTQRDLTRIAPTAPVAGVFARAAPGADPAQVSSALDRAAAGTNASVVGTAKTQATYTSTLDTVLLVTTALLAVAMLIAAVGIANTLALSVIERTRESGLLRALGLTRGQLRATLAAEATVLSLVGTLLGIGLGTVFGWAAITAILGSDFEVVFAVPGLRLTGLAAAAVAAGLLASILPARRAANTSVVSALADR